MISLHFKQDFKVRSAGSIPKKRIAFKHRLKEQRTLKDPDFLLTRERLLFTQNSYYGDGQKKLSWP